MTSYRRAAGRFAAAVLRGIGWRAVLLTQLLGAALALQYWLEAAGPGQPRLLPVLIVQALCALCVMLAALAADQAVRRGRGIWRSFVMALAGITAAAAGIQWAVNGWLGVVSADHGYGQFQYFAFSAGGWSAAMLAYLNRQSAERILAGVRGDELQRLGAERRLLTSRLAAAQVQIDPAAVLRRLADVRDLYAARCPEADDRLDQLITQLRDSARRGATAAEGLTGS